MTLKNVKTLFKWKPWPWNWPWAKIIECFKEEPKKPLSPMEAFLEQLKESMPPIEEEPVKNQLPNNGNGFSVKELVEMGIPEEDIDFEEIDHGNGHSTTLVSVPEKHADKIEASLNNQKSFEEFAKDISDKVEKKIEKIDEEQKKKENESHEFIWERIRAHTYVLHTRIDLSTWYYANTEAEEDEDQIYDIQSGPQGNRIIILTVKPNKDLMRCGVQSVQFQKERPFSIAFEFGECFSVEKVKESILRRLGLNIKPLDPKELEQMYYNEPDKTDEPDS